MSLAYVGVTFTNKLFNGTHFRLITGCGLCAHIAQMWMKRMKLAEMQEKIEPAYAQQLQCYARLFSDASKK